MALRYDVDCIRDAVVGGNWGALYLLTSDRALTTVTGKDLAKIVWARFDQLTRDLMAARLDADKLRAEVDGLRAQNERLTVSLQRLEGGGDG
jgi:hypothetical protein